MRVRTIEQLYEEVKRMDPETALTKTALRNLVISGAIPSRRAGQKYLVTVEALETYMNGAASSAAHVPGYGEIRPVG